MAITDKGGFHEQNDAFNNGVGWNRGLWFEQDTEFTYTFENFFHPFISELIEKLNKESLDGVFNSNYHKEWATEFFDQFYTSLASDVVKINHFCKEIDVHEGGPYANYNWELLFHIPLTIAVHLSKNQRFAEAQRWFHFIFDPTSSDIKIDPKYRFWKFIAFREGVDITKIDELVALLSKTDPTPNEEILKKKLLFGYEAIKNKPFQPHAVARTRFVSYQYNVVMKYLDNLIAWGDSLFRQDTIETINEATQLYVLAANLLGRRPQRIPPKGITQPKTFFKLKEEGHLNEIGDALVDLEGMFPFNIGLPQVNQPEINKDASRSLFGVGRTLYFCIPYNEKMLSYWDTVGDRLFKIRNCMNIEGGVRQLALFDQQIDPGLLVKATAAGININSIVSGINQPISNVRSSVMIQKALELCFELRSLGSSVLSAIEKGDGEQLALLRQGHEIKIQQMTKEVRFLQWKQTQESSESLLRSRANALERYRYYQRLLGLNPDNNVAPDTFPLDRRELNEENFDEAFAELVGQYDKIISTQGYPPLKLTGNVAPANQSGATGQGNLYLNANENAELNEHLPNAKRNQTIAFASRQIAPVFSLIPDFPINIHFWGIGGTIIFGGSALTKNVQTAADILDLMASRENQDANSASKTASYERRADEWILQCNLAARELMQIGRQLIGSLISEQIAQHEYLNMQKQIDHSQEVYSFLQEKYTNEELYAWMQGETSRLFYEYYRFTFDTARKAEQTMKHELKLPEVDATDYIKFNYWDGGRKGLLSGEALYLDLKRMEMAYHEQNKRELELTKHVSLRQLNPLQLLSLKTKGVCEVSLPEWLFDLDCPGHYMRRIKTVSLSIPSVAGPFTSVNCTLSLMKSSVRVSSLATDYGNESDEDPNIIHYYGSVQNIVTSSGNNDSGLFETNLHDERFLPFEGAGTISTWKLELPNAYRQFDYNTITDVILHIRYTARQGGETLRKPAVDHLNTLLADANRSDLAVLLSLQHDFSNEWYRFTIGSDNFKTEIKQEFFPYIVQSKNIKITEIQLCPIQSEPMTLQGIDMDDISNKLNSTGGFELSLAPIDGILERKQKANVFILFKYQVE